MNQLEFDVVLQETIDSIKKLLSVKGGEYAGSTDRLANFKRGASLTGATPLQCLFIYLSKHYDAIATFVRDDATGVNRERSEPIDGRLDDIINYCLLAKALIRENVGRRADEAGVDTGDLPINSDRVWSGLVNPSASVSPLSHPGLGWDESRANGNIHSR